jgi:galactarate dehydratase
VIIDRNTLHWWAVRHAAEHNGYRLDVPPDEVMETPGAQTMRAVPHAENVAALAIETGVSQMSEMIFLSAWGDGSEFPTLSRAMFLASEADDLKRAGILSTLAQAEFGGAYGSRWNVRRTRDAGRRELDELSERLDEATDRLVHEGIHTYRAD